MKSPTIKHKVCEYNGRLWAIHSAERKRSREGYADVILRLVDGDEVVFAEMTWKDYDAMNSKLEEQEFSITSPPPGDVGCGCVYDNCIHKAVKPPSPPPTQRKPWENRRK